MFSGNEVAQVAIQGAAARMVDFIEFVQQNDDAFAGMDAHQGRDLFEGGVDCADLCFSAHEGCQALALHRGGCLQRAQRAFHQGAEELADLTFTSLQVKGMQREEDGMEVVQSAVPFCRDIEKTAGGDMVEGMFEHIQQRCLAQAARAAQQQVLLAAGLQVGEDILQLSAPPIEVRRLLDGASKLVAVDFDAKGGFVQAAHIQARDPGITVHLAAPALEVVFQAQFSVWLFHANVVLQALGGAWRQAGDFSPGFIIHQLDAAGLGQQDFQVVRFYAPNIGDFKGQVNLFMQMDPGRLQIDNQLGRVLQAFQQIFDMFDFLLVGKGQNGLFVGRGKQQVLAASQLAGQLVELPDQAIHLAFLDLQLLAAAPRFQQLVPGLFE